MRLMKLLAVVLFVSVLSGCTSHEVVPSSGPRKATSLQQVKVYQKYPKKYEDLGLIQISVTPAMTWDKNGDATPAFDALKAKAAALGANGILLTIDPAKYEFLAGARDHGVSFDVPMNYNPKTAFAQAVFVIKE